MASSFNFCRFLSNRILKKDNSGTATVYLQRGKIRRTKQRTEVHMKAYMSQCIKIMLCKKGKIDQFFDPQAAKTPNLSSDRRKPSSPTDTAHQREIHATRPRTGI